MNATARHTHRGIVRSTAWRLIAAGAALGLAAALILSIAPRAEAQPSAGSAIEEANGLASAFKSVARAVKPSVVNIQSTRRLRLGGGRSNRSRGSRSPLDSLRDFFGEDFGLFGFPDLPFEQQGIGSGVIVSSDGYLLTNNHVIRHADEIIVTLHDDRQFEARVVGADPKSDLAVLKIDADDLQAAKLDREDLIEVGDWVIAVGSPLGLRQTVTHGIVSAKGRANVGVAEYEDFIQTDASINPGNSGGPLMNLKGEVIGITTAIATRTGGSIGIGFAIPSGMAASIMESIIDEGRVIRGWLGVMIQDLGEGLADSFGYDQSGGALVAEVVKGSPADEAGLRAEDIITSLGGKPIRDTNQLRNRVATTRPGEEVAMEVFREGKIERLRVKIGELESETVAAAPAEEKPDETTRLGMTVRNVRPQEARRLGLDDDRGVVVDGVDRGSIAERAGVRNGDLIVRVNGRDVATIREFRRAIGNADVARGVRMQVLTEGSRRFVFLRERR